MTAALAEHAGLWTEEEYLALTDTPDRIELFDWSLYVSPAPTLRHQGISSRLFVALDGPAVRAGLVVYEAINVRLRPGRMPIPDLAIIEPHDIDTLVVDADAVRLVCEIVSPSNASTDRVLKMHYYATAGIGWYLLVEQDTATLHLHKLEEGQYREHAVAKPGETLTLTDPVTAEIDPAVLLPPA